MKTPRGNPNAAVIVTEYGDFQCPACKAAEFAVVEPLLEKYEDRIRFDFVNFPIQSIHPFALPAAVAAECTADQEKFWEYHDLVYTNQDQLSTDNLRVWAESLGLDMELFNRCLRAKIKRNIVLEEYAAATEKGVRGTPTFFVNGVQVNSSSDALSAAIENALKQGEMQL